MIARGFGDTTAPLSTVDKAAVAALVRIKANKAAAGKRAAIVKAAKDKMNAIRTLIAATPKGYSVEGKPFKKPWVSWRKYTETEQTWLGWRGRPFDTWPPKPTASWGAYVVDTVNRTSHADQWDAIVGPFYLVNKDLTTWPEVAQDRWNSQIALINTINESKKSPSFGEQLTSLGQFNMQLLDPRVMINPVKAIKTIFGSISLTLAALDTGVRDLNPLDSTLAKFNAAGKRAGGIGRLLGGAGNVALKKPIETVVIVYACVVAIADICAYSAADSATAGAEAGAEAGEVGAGQLAPGIADPLSAGNLAVNAGGTVAPYVVPGTEAAAGAGTAAAGAGTAGGGGGGTLTGQEILTYGTSAVGGAKTLFGVVGGSKKPSAPSGTGQGAPQGAAPATGKPDNSFWLAIAAAAYYLL